MRLIGQQRKARYQLAKTSTKKAAAKKGGKDAKDRMAKARAARGTGVGSKYSGMSTEALLKAKSNTPSEDKAAHYAIRRALRAGGYKISEHREPKAPKKGKSAAKAAVKSATKGKASKAKASKKSKASKGGDWEDED